MSVSAGSQSDLVFNLGGGITDQWQDSEGNIIKAKYHTQPSGETYSGMNVDVTDWGSNAEYMYDYFMSGIKDRFVFSPCSLGDICSVGTGKGDFAKHHSVTFLLGNHLVSVYSQIYDNAMSPADLMTTAQKISDVLSGPYTEPAQITYPEAWDTYWNDIAKRITQLEEEIADKNQQLDETLAQQNINQLSNEVPGGTDSSYNEVELMNPSIENILSSGITNRDIQTINTQLNYLKNVQNEFLNNIDLRKDVESYSKSSIDDLIKKRGKIESDLALLKSQAEDELTIVNEIQTEIDKLMVNQAFGSDIVGSGNYYNADDDSSSQSESYEKDPLGIIDMNGGEGLQAFQDAIDRQKVHDDKLLELKNKINDLEYSLKIVEHAIGINSIMNK